MNKTIIRIVGQSEVKETFNINDLVHIKSINLNGIIIGNGLDSSCKQVLVFYTSGTKTPGIIHMDTNNLERWTGTITITNE